MRHSPLVPKYARSREKRLDIRAGAIHDELVRSFAERIRRLEYEGGDVDVVAHRLAEEASEQFAELCEEIVEDPEGWVT